MPLSDRVLMGPGPCNPYPEAVEALARPMLGHLDPDFVALLDETCDRLRTVFRTGAPMTLPISGTGSAGMEAAFVNLVRPGDPVVVGVNGVFGARMCDVAARCGAEVVAVEAPWGRPIDPERLLAAHPAPRIIAVVHAETSTGVRSDIAPLGEGKGAALLLVDCVTSLGGIEVDVDGWGVDVAYAGTQKCLGVAPGLAPLTVSERAREQLVERSPSWYLDLRMIGRYTGPATGARTYHHTAPVSMIMALHAGLGAILDEGLEAAIARHADCGRLLQDGLVELGFELFAAEGHRLPELTTVWVPDGVDDAKVRATLLDRHGVEIGGGLGEFAGRVWRIGCMGHTARPRNVTLLLAALAELTARR
ncbi:MAG TPA: alanine--glyoxylate aminotransferase family protein [Acidimicrobiales bacterium]|nr:alanine--glyoxylate aminotransferase family protein [Acidimicrobiales bacterium]